MAKICALTLLCLSGSAWCSFAVETEAPLVLEVRPELLTRNQGLPHYPADQRNPFAWPEIKRPDAGGQSAAEQKIMENFAQLRIDAIIWNKKNPQAIINGNLLAEKDTISGATIVTIQEDSVVLEKEGVRHSLEFNKFNLNLRPDK